MSDRAREPEADNTVAPPERDLTTPDETVAVRRDDSVNMLRPAWDVLTARYDLQEVPQSSRGREVCRATDRQCGQTVRIVRWSAPSDAQTTSLEAYRERTRLVSALEHPGLLVLHDCGQDAFGRYVVTEALESDCLADLFAEGDTLDSDTVARLGMRLSAALSRYHGCGLVHAHVVPEWIFIDDDGDPKLLDSGFVAPPATALPDESFDRNTDALPIRAPELRRGALPDVRTDVWCLGAVLYQLLTGIAPDTTIDPARLPEPLRNVILQALAADPAHRYDSAGALHLALCAAIGADPEPDVSADIPTELGTPESVSELQPLLVVETADLSIDDDSPADEDMSQEELAPAPALLAATATDSSSPQFKDSTPPPPIATAPRQTTVESRPSFRHWYHDKFRWTRTAGTVPSYLLQTLVWSGLGFVWIPAWYLGTRPRPANHRDDA